MKKSINFAILMMGISFVACNQGQQNPSESETPLDSSHKENERGAVAEEGELRITDSLTEAVQRYARLGIFADGRALVAKGKEFNDYKYGYIDYNGNEVIPCQYDYAQTFHDGRAVVGMGQELSKQKYGYIDTEGKLITPIQYSSMNSFKNGYVLVTLNDRSFYIDRDGNEADSLTAVRAQRDSDTPRQFSHETHTGEYYPNGIEKTRYEVGFVDKDGNESAINSCVAI